MSGRLGIQFVLIECQLSVGKRFSRRPRKVLVLIVYYVRLLFYAVSATMA